MITKDDLMYIYLWISTCLGFSMVIILSSMDKYIEFIIVLVITIINTIYTCFKMLDL